MEGEEIDVATGERVLEGLSALTYLLHTWKEDQDAALLLGGRNDMFNDSCHQLGKASLMPVLMRDPLAYLEIHPIGFRDVAKDAHSAFVQTVIVKIIQEHAALLFSELLATSGA